jgi:lipopolysaccharide transport system permease protein
MSRTIIQPPGALNLPSWGALWGGREIFYQFGKRDILLRYRQTAIGVAWVFIQPLVGAGVFTLVFGGIAQLPSGGVPYFIFSYAGLLGWNLFNSIISRSAGSLVANQALVSKVFFPRLLVPLSSMVSVMLDFLIAFGLFVVLLFVFGINPGWPLLALPIWVLVTIVLANGIGLAAAAGTVRYRDVSYFLPWTLQILLYATPIAYSLEAVPQDLRWLFNLNPLSWLLEGYRWSLLGQSAPEWWQVIALVVVSLVVAFGGLMIFQRLERAFADVI